jgi:hypothetical protein
MAKVRELRIPNMCARMQRLQGEDLNDPDDDTGDDEIYGIVTVVERDARGRYIATYVGGSDQYITVTKSDRHKWKHLQPTGEWLQMNLPDDAFLEVTWYLMEEDSIIDDDLAEALEDLAEGIAEEVADLPGVARAKRMFHLVTAVVAKVSGDDVLGSHKQFLNLSREPQPYAHTRVFPCQRSADYDAYAQLYLSKAFKT